MSRLLKKFIHATPHSTPPPVPYGSKPTVPVSDRRPSKPKNSGILKVNGVYYPNYRIYRGESPATLNYDCITHVFYAFAHVGPDGSVFLSDEWADTQMDVDGVKGCLGSFMVLKQQHPHLKVVLSIGGGAASQNFAIVASSPIARDHFARTASNLVHASGLDGLDIDWEHPSNPQQGNDFLALLAAIRIHLPDENFLLTAALPAGQWALQNIDLYRSQDYLDFINLMSYDFSGSWTPQAGHQAQLFAPRHDQPSGAAAVDYIKSTRFPANKILLGIPVYGRSFLGASRPGQAHQGHGGEDGVFEYKNLPRQGAQELVDQHAVAAFCVGGDGGFVTYDNPETVRKKAQYCNENHLGGLFYWTGTADVPRGPRSLIEAGFTGLHSA